MIYIEEDKDKKEYINVLFFFKQKTAYEMRISDWSSDVCSSDLRQALADIVVRVAEHLQCDALTEEGAERLPRRAAQPDLDVAVGEALHAEALRHFGRQAGAHRAVRDRKSTRLNSSH